MLKIVFPDDGRRALLRDEVDQEYSKFVGRLPTPLRDYACLRSTYTGKSGSDRLGGIFNLNPLVVAAPWLFWDAFPLDAESLCVIAKAGSFLGASYVILDHLIDDQVEEPALASLLQQALFERALQLFRTQLGPTTPFWFHLDRLWADLRDSLVFEWQRQRNPYPISVDEFRSMAAAKSVPLIITIAALSQMSNKPNLLDEAEKSLREVGSAVQLWHDVGDWRNDYRSKHITYFLSEIMRRFIKEQKSASLHDISTYFLNYGYPTLYDIDELIKSHELEVEFLNLSHEWFCKAFYHAESIDSSIWSMYLDQWKNEVHIYALSISDPDNPESVPVTFLQVIERLASSH